MFLSWSHRRPALAPFASSSFLKTCLASSCSSLRNVRTSIDPSCSELCPRRGGKRRAACDTHSRWNSMSQTELERLRAEIDEQPEVVQRLLDRQLQPVREVARSIQQRDPAAVVLVARGSSDNAAVYGRYLLEVCNRRLTSLAAPSGLTLYGRGPRLDRTVVIGVSQSGQGEDVIAYVRRAGARGAAPVALVNDEASPLAEAAEWVLARPAGPERSIPGTR